MEEMSMKSKKIPFLFLAGAMIAAPLTAPVQAAEAYLKALPSRQTFYADGQQVQLEAYNIDGYNYVKLSDLSALVGFDLAYDGATNRVYIGETPEAQESQTVTIPQSEDKLVLKEGDTVLCDDGTLYQITDMSRYDTNVFASGPVGELPTATCDWSLFPEVELPKAEARHFSTSTGEALFVRNLYETRRMQYTIYNALGSEPSAWKGSTPLATVELSIPADLDAYTSAFWPWRASELENLVHSRPNSRYYVEAWDYYLNGVFQYTRYCVVSL
jgi:hypothetical protein